MDSAQSSPATPPLRAPGALRTTVPARLDRLPWSRLHLLLVVALGITWVLDGLEVTIVGSMGPALQSRATLALSSAELGATASCYVAGAVLGALLWGALMDRLGRRHVFFATLCTYLGGVLLSALAWNFWSFALFRLLTGCGIGGEYAAVNSAIDELIPAKYRGRIDLMVNGSFWLGAAAGAGASIWVYSIRTFYRRRWAGAWGSRSAACSGSRCCCCGGSCRRARAGSSPTAATRRLSRLSR